MPAQTDKQTLILKKIVFGSENLSEDGQECMQGLGCLNLGDAEDVLLSDDGVPFLNLLIPPNKPPSQ